MARKINVKLIMELRDAGWIITKYDRIHKTHLKAFCQRSLQHR